MFLQFSNHGTVALLVASFTALCPLHTAAQNHENLPLWEVGAFAAGISQQAYPGASQQIDRALVLPFFIYRGKYFRVDQGTVGVRAIKTDDMEVDVGFGGAFGSSSNEIEARKGMPDLGTLVEFGPRAKWKLVNKPGQGELRADVALRGVFDLSDGFKDRGIALEPELVYEHAETNGWRYATSLGLMFGDERLADTFYGVAPAYAKAGRPAYSASAGLLASRFSVRLTRALSPSLRFFGFGRLASVQGSANEASPLVRQNTGASIGLGLTYIFAKSSRSSTD